MTRPLTWKKGWPKAEGTYVVLLKCGDRVLCRCERDSTDLYPNSLVYSVHNVSRYYGVALCYYGPLPTPPVRLRKKG